MSASASAFVCSYSKADKSTSILPLSKLTQANLFKFGLQQRTVNQEKKTKNKTKSKTDTGKKLWQKRMRSQLHQQVKVRLLGLTVSAVHAFFHAALSDISLQNRLPPWYWFAGSLSKPLQRPSLFAVSLSGLFMHRTITVAVGSPSLANWSVDCSCAETPWRLCNTEHRIQISGFVHGHSVKAPYLSTSFATWPCFRVFEAVRLTAWSYLLLIFFWVFPCNRL